MVSGKRQRTEDSQQNQTWEVVLSGGAKRSDPWNVLLGTWNFPRSEAPCQGKHPPGQAGRTSGQRARTRGGNRRDPELGSDRGRGRRRPGRSAFGGRRRQVPAKELTHLLLGLLFGLKLQQGGELRRVEHGLGAGDGGIGDRQGVHGAGTGEADHGVGAANGDGHADAGFAGGRGGRLRGALGGKQVDERRGLCRATAGESL